MRKFAIRSFLCAVTLGLAFWAPDATAQHPVAAARQVIALEGDGWLLACDPKNEGREQAWWKQPSAEAQAVAIPSIIQETFPGYHGVVWYWRPVEVPEHPVASGRYLLRFGAVDYLAGVYVNDTLVGSHEGGETPFTLDITDAVKPGAANMLSVRVLNPGGERIDGIALDETPHRNKRPTLVVGSMLAYGGIIEPVDLLMVPPVYIDSLFVRADWKTGECKVEAIVKNATKNPLVSARLQFQAGPAAEGGAACAETSIAPSFAPGESSAVASVQVPRHRLWGLEDPYLYTLAAKLSSAAGVSDALSVRFGFRELRVDAGYFHLNGKRIFLKSSHTGNHCPAGQILPPRQAPDLLRKDLLYMKSSGFNTIRFIAGIAHPWQLDLCDEIGLMAYQETLAGWCLADSPEMAKRFDLSIRETLLRDRNHPSFTIFGLLNETQDGPVFRHAVDSLALVRSIDDTRLTLLDSGRWDGQFNIGSLSNPGGREWEFQWGVDDPGYDASKGAKWGQFGGYIVGAGDAHVYPGTPHTPEIESGIRNLGKESKPVFLSEYGIGSLMNAIRELRHYEQNGLRADLEDVKYLQNTVDRFNADWQRFGMDGVYPFPEDMLRESQRLHGRQRTLGFDLIRSNPKICGYNLTGLLDHGFTGEGLWSYWREWKPGIVDVLQDGWAPLRWCLFAAPMHAYLGRPIRLEAILANEDALPAGEYPVTLRVVGPAGIAWEKTASVTVTPEGPLAIPVCSEDVTLHGPAGEYTLAANLERGGAPLGGRLTFHLSSAVTAPGAPSACLAWGVPEPVLAWLQAHGVTCSPFEGAPDDARQVILVGEGTDELGARIALMKRVARGSTVLFLSPKALKRGDNAVGWLPLKNKGRGYDFSDWLYHKECVAKPHAIFEGLPGRGLMDWDYFGPVIPHFIIEGADVPDETAAVAFALCHSAPPGGYASGVLNGWYRFGSGWFMANSLAVLENVDKHPAADQLLLNMIACAAQKAAGPLETLPGDFGATLESLGFK